MNDRYVYIVFSKTGTVLSRVIAKFIENKYSHVSISLDNQFDNMYSFGRIYQSNPIIAGLVTENLSKGIFVRSESNECLIYRLKVTDEQYTKTQEVINSYMRNQKQYKYNALGLVYSYLDKPIKRENRYFCSQFVGEVLIKSGVYKTDKIPELIRPTDLLNIEEKEIIYDGPTRELLETLGIQTLKSAI